MEKVHLLHVQLFHDDGFERISIAVINNHYLTICTLAAARKQNNDKIEQTIYQKQRNQIASWVVTHLIYFTLDSTMLSSCAQLHV